METMSVNAANDRSALSVAGARESTREVLGGMVPMAVAEAADSVVLVVSELVTNALRHAVAPAPWT